MTMTPRYLHLAFVLCVFLPKSSTFSCYVCTGESCKDPYKTSADVDELEKGKLPIPISCTLSGSGFRHYCMKVFATTNDGEKVWARGCYPRGDRDPGDCTDIFEEEYSDIEVCELCDTDKCNRSNSLVNVQILTAFGVIYCILGNAL